MKIKKAIMNFRKARAVGGWSRLFAGIGIMLLCCNNLPAQKTDTLSPLRDFAAISTGYKQIPMYLSLEMRSSTNFITSEEDTATIQGEFYLQKEQSYVRFGEFEQIVNDSMALLVSNKMQAMILYTNAATTVKQMQGMMGASMPDSSIKTMAASYTSLATKLNKETTVIELQSRALVYGSTLAKETVTMKYETRSRLPKEVITTKRSLLPLDSTQYRMMQTEPGGSDKLLMLEGSYFLIKEQVSAFIYTKIEKGRTDKVPVTIADRISKTEDGEYIPVKQYENYMLSKND